MRQFEIPALKLDIWKNRIDIDVDIDFDINADIGNDIDNTT